jgi:hypothetical protein
VAVGRIVEEGMAKGNNRAPQHDRRGRRMQHKDRDTSAGGLYSLRFFVDRERQAQAPAQYVYHLLAEQRAVSYS